MPVADLRDISVAVPEAKPLDQLPKAEKPEAGAITSALAAIPMDDERTRMGVKAQAHLDAMASLTGGGGFKFQRDGITIATGLAPAEVRDRVGNLVGVEVRCVAIDAEGNLLPATDGIHRVVNPPTMVADGTAHEEEMTLPNGKTTKVLMPNFVEDPVAALQDWLFGSVVHVARQLGWKG